MFSGNLLSALQGLGNVHSTQINTSGGLTEVRQQPQQQQQARHFEDSHGSSSSSMAFSSFQSLLALSSAIVDDVRPGQYADFLRGDYVPSSIQGITRNGVLTEAAMVSLLRDSVETYAALAHSNLGNFKSQGERLLQIISNERVAARSSGRPMRDMYPCLVWQCNTIFSSAAERDKHVEASHRGYMKDQVARKMDDLRKNFRSPATKDRHERVKSISKPSTTLRHEPTARTKRSVQIREEVEDEDEEVEEEDSSEYVNLPQLKRIRLDTLDNTSEQQNRTKSKTNKPVKNFMQHDEDDDFMYLY